MAHLAMSPGETTVEVTVCGAEAGPEPACLAHLNAVLPALDLVVRSANAHLDAFIDRERLSPGETWWLDGLRVLRDEVGKPQIELQFTLEGDRYGHWSVVFSGESPTAFARRQI